MNRQSDKYTSWAAVGAKNAWREEVKVQKDNKILKQAGSELCQTQVQLGLAVTRNNLMAHLLKILCNIQYQKKFRLSSSKY